MNLQLSKGRGIAYGLAGYITLILLIALVSFMAAYYPNPLPAIGAALFILIVALFMVSPRAVVLLLLGLRASLDITKGFASLYISESVRVSPAFFCSLLLIGLGLVYILTHRVRILDIPLVVALLFFQLLLILQLLVTSDVLAGLMEVLRFLSTVILYILVYDLFAEREKLRSLVVVIIISSLFPVVVGLYQVIGDAGQYITGFVRANGTFVHPNPYAFYLIIILALLLNNLLSGRERVLKVWPQAVLALTAAACLVFTYTRTAWIGLFIILFLIAVFRDRRFLWVFGVLAVVFLLAAPLRLRFYDLATSLNSVTHRLYIWEAGLDKLPAYPLLGRGPGSFELLDVYGEQAHNDLLRVFVELGMLGLIAYLLIAVELIGRLWRLVKAGGDSFSSSLARAVFSVTCVFIMASLTGNLFFRPAIQWYYWALVAAVFNAAAIRVPEGK